MKSWLGVIGRACLEFAIILLLISFAAGASSSVAVLSGGLRALYVDSVRSALDLVPLAVVFTLFLAFFSFELRVPSRLAGWLGLVCLGAILLSFGVGLRRAPLIGDIAATARPATSEKARFLAAGEAAQRGRVALWIGEYQGSEVVDAIAVDFGSDYPRLAYSPRAAFDRESGMVDVQGRSYSATQPPEKSIALVPEARYFAGAWIWDRLAAMDDAPLYLVFAAAGGFLLLGVGFRFLCRITGWPLANALVAAAGLAGLVVLDAALSGPWFIGVIAAFSRRVGILLPEPVPLAIVEGILGIILGTIDIAGARKGGSNAMKRRAGDE